MPETIQRFRRLPGWIAVCLLLSAVLPAAPETAGAQDRITVHAEGAVRSPGTYVLPRGATLSTLILAAGGYADNADLAGGTLARGSGPPIPAPLAHPRLLKGSPGDLPLQDGDTLRVPMRRPGERRTSPPAPVGEEPFLAPNNFGVTGLLETPTARVMKENRYRAGYTWVAPYRYYFATIGLFDRFEVTGRVDEALGIPTKTGSSSKDKAFDFKLQLLKEDTFLPAFAVAVSDPHGTRVYASQSIVASKRISDFDLTLGFGNGRLGRRQLPPQGEGFRVELFTDPRKWVRDALPFGGIRYAPTSWLSLLAEYSPIRYERQTRDPAQKRYFPDPVRSPVNFGLRIQPLRWLDLAASWQRGKELGVSASVAFDIGRPLAPIRDPVYLKPPDSARDPLSERIARSLSTVGFSDIAVSNDGSTLRIDAQNDRYFFTPRAVEVLLSTIAPFVPENVEYLRVQLKENGIPAVEAGAPASALSEEGGEFRRSARIREAVGYRAENFFAPLRPTAFPRRFDYSLKPSFTMFLNDPTGYVKYRLGLAGSVSAFPWRGGTALAGVEGYPVNNISPSNVAFSIPIRSDVSDYKKETIALGRLLFDQVVATRTPLSFRVEAGMLETMFGGVDAEAAIPLGNGRILAGASGSLVRKRESENPLAFRNGGSRHTALLLARLNVPEFDLAIDAKYGRFLAGDQGVWVSVSKFIRGVTLTAWYSATDTGVFTDPYNRGYHDKGISVDIPIRLFAGIDSRTVHRYSLSPWTRDVAQDIDRYQPLFDRIGRNVGILLDRDRGSAYKFPK